jgi:hypothetical protein
MGPCCWQVGGTIVVLEVQRSARSEALKEAKMRAELEVSYTTLKYITVWSVELSIPLLCCTRLWMLLQQFKLQKPWFNHQNRQSRTYCTLENFPLPRVYPPLTPI